MRIYDEYELRFISYMNARGASICVDYSVNRWTYTVYPKNKSVTTLTSLICNDKIVKHSIKIDRLSHSRYQMKVVYCDEYFILLALKRKH